MALDFKGFTDNVATDCEYKVTGDGIFDDMMETFTAHVKAQYASGAISNVDFATVYLGGMQTAMTTSAKIFLEAGIILSLLS